nr:uncharacterized protein LOC127340172 [Lolium perenne]
MAPASTRTSGSPANPQGSHLPGPPPRLPTLHTAALRKDGNFAVRTPGADQGAGRPPHPCTAGGKAPSRMATSSPHGPGARRSGARMGSRGARGPCPGPNSKRPDLAPTPPRQAPPNRAGRAPPPPAELLAASDATRAATFFLRPSGKSPRRPSPEPLRGAAAATSVPRSRRHHAEAELHAAAHAAQRAALTSRLGPAPRPPREEGGFF